MEFDYRTFIDATQRGFAYGICDQNGTRYCERHVRCGTFSPEEINQAYMKAQMGAGALLQTLKRGRRDLIRDWGAMPGNIYAF